MRMLAMTLRGVMRRISGMYRPERHYMRGPRP